MATLNDGDPTPAATPAPKTTKTQVSPARNIVGVVLLIIFATIFVLEFSANRGYNSAVQAIEAKIPKDDPADLTAQLPDLPTKAEVETILGRQPDGALVKEGTENKATYTWKGLIRKFVLTAYYSTGENPSLIRISTD